MDKKFYCHYNEITFEIVQIGSDEICNLNIENIKSFEIPFDPIAKSILLGETSLINWKVVTTDYNKTVLIFSDKILDRIINSNNISRIKLLNLKEIDNNSQTDKPIIIFVTKKKDPTILFKVFKTKKWKISKDFSVFTDKTFIN